MCLDILNDAIKQCIMMIIANKFRKIKKGLDLINNSVL